MLELRPDAPVPDLKPTEVLVRTRAVSINPLDTRVSCNVLRWVFFIVLFSFWRVWLLRKCGKMKWQLNGGLMRKVLAQTVASK